MSCITLSVISAVSDCSTAPETFADTLSSHGRGLKLRNFSVRGDTGVAHSVSYLAYRLNIRGIVVRFLAEAGTLSSLERPDWLRGLCKLLFNG